MSLTTANLQRVLQDAPTVMFIDNKQFTQWAPYREPWCEPPPLSNWVRMDPLLKLVWVSIYVAVAIFALAMLTGCTTEDGEVITPPSRYAFPFKGKVTLVWLDTVAIHDRCGPTAVSCAPIGPVTECTIWINKVFKRYKGWRVSIMRHEQAHCNGWPANHPT